MRHSLPSPAERETTRLRNADIIRRFARVHAKAAPGEALSRAELLCRVRREPPGGYYVTFRHALGRLQELRRDPDGAASHAKSPYWAELAAKVDSERASGPSLTPGQALARVLASERPSADCLSDSYLWRIYLEANSKTRSEATPKTQSKTASKSRSKTTSTTHPNSKTTIKSHRNVHHA